MEMKRGLGLEKVLTEAERSILANDIITRGVAEFVENTPGELKHGLLNEKLRVKFGIDPTSSKIHIGRAVAILKLRDIQLLGHQIVLIIGDITGEVGDTSDKVAGRPMLSEEQVRENMVTYAEQAGKILDMSKVEVHYNSEWLDKLSFSDVSKLADLFGVGDFIQRDIIRRRLSKGQRVSVRELMYPIMQGYDSVAIKADLELGGADQRFNLFAGRTIEANFGMKKQMVLMTNLISGTDGEKMSSSTGNVINLTDSPEDIFGKVMSSHDKVIMEYFIHCTRVPMTQVKEIEIQLERGANPRDIKMLLAHIMTAQIYGEGKALQAEERFRTIFQKREVPESVEEIKIEGSRKIIDVLIATKLAGSKSEAKRLLSQKGIRVNNNVVEENYEIPHDALLKKGKRTFLRIK